ncbi:hypothetical protein STRATTON_61 [Erwinia phage vB_EamM_Stratton]|uniref:Uncharacterized protein n=2 Tax=Erskinevirus EaH2 TaxID=2169883 RepID=A0A1B2IGU1_9CAUD|nr:hypothetical protein G173_gp229 [Erwinia phage phiEaH2]AFQ96774.1 hypothetical protein [Erwinia phage phiEaH2]ANZ50486.1 hypothetical protein STRATTON_61 [Erwinia phage vB_EamM_Stratton]
MLSAAQIDHDLNGMRYGVDPVPLVGYSNKVEAIKAAISYASIHNAGTAPGDVDKTIAPIIVQQRGNTLLLRSTGLANNLTEGDKTHIYRVRTAECSEAWQQSFDGSPEYYTYGATTYEEVEFDSILNFIKGAGLTVS